MPVSPAGRNSRDAPTVARAVLRCDFGRDLIWVHPNRSRIAFSFSGMRFGKGQVIQLHFTGIVTVSVYGDVSACVPPGK